MAVMVEVFATLCILPGILLMMGGVVVGDASVLVSCCFEAVSVHFLVAKLDIELGGPWACSSLCSSPGVVMCSSRVSVREYFISITIIKLSTSVRTLLLCSVLPLPLLSALFFRWETGFGSVVLQLFWNF